MSNARERVLYRFFDSAGELLYIGKSVRAWQRFTEHSQGSKFYPHAAQVTLQRGFNTDVELSMAEIAAIHAEHPRYNKAHNDRVVLDDRAGIAAADRFVNSLILAAIKQDIAEMQSLVQPLKSNSDGLVLLIGLLATYAAGYLMHLRGGDSEAISYLEETIKGKRCPAAEGG